MVHTKLENRLKAILDDFPAKVSLYCVDMTSGEVLAAIGEETQVVSASTIKVAVLLCALQKVADGALDLAQFVPLGRFCDDTQVFEAEYRQDGASLWEMLYWMIVSSDNTATNAVLELLTFDAINAYCSSLGLTATKAQRFMLDFAAASEGRQNYTSARDQFRLYELLYHGKILTPELRAAAFDFLGRVRHMGGLQRYIPYPVTVYHKPGGLDGLNHDAGIFCTEKPYYLGIFTWDGPAMDGEPEQNRLIGKLSRLTYDYVTKGVLP